MAVTRESVIDALKRIAVPDGGDLVSRDLIRALSVEGGKIRFVVDVSDPEAAKRMEPSCAAAEKALRALPGVSDVSIVMTAHGPQRRPAEPPPSLRGQPQHSAPAAAPAGPQPIPGVDRILAIGSGKGGVGKSTVSSNLAVALAKAGRRVGLLDADIYGPSQPKMMGITTRPDAPDGKVLVPPQAHGVTVMSLGLLLRENEAVIWRGPMIMGALTQMLQQVAWGKLDVLLVDLPPGTGDVQLTLCQKAQVTGAVVVSTPQDVALIDARKALDMFLKMKTPVLGLIENMSTYVCPNCGHEEHIFGHGGVVTEAKKLGLPFLGEIPLSLDVRLGGDSGRPVALGEGAVAEAYDKLARRLIDQGAA